MWAAPVAELSHKSFKVDALGTIKDSKCAKKKAEE
jgi:hypothetical protein